jgi:hypothetical protein
MGLCGAWYLAFTDECVIKQVSVFNREKELFKTKTGFSNCCLLRAGAKGRQKYL